jgi:hypothetical protein
MKEKHVPMRRCIACMQSKPKAELIKVNPNEPGRGRYLCRSEECLALAIKKKRLPKDFEL